MKLLVEARHEDWREDHYIRDENSKTDRVPKTSDEFLWI